MAFAGRQYFLSFLTFSLVYFANARSEFFQTEEACDSTMPYVFNSKTGNFTSPGTHGYPNNKMCQWDIKLPSSTLVEVTFHDFNLEESKTCKPYDYVKLSENCRGKWGRFQNGSDAYCGNQTKFTLRSRCGHVRVEFRSDDSDNGLGFNASYVAIIDKSSPAIDCLGANNSCEKKYSETEQNPFTLTCDVQGHPQPEVFWSKQATPQSPWRPLDTQADRIVDFHNGTLHFKELTMNDTGKYRCYANNSLGKDDREVSLHVAKKCICPKHIRTNWYSVPPYTNENQRGLFHYLLEEIVQTCCGNCTGGHGPSEIVYSKSSMKKSLMEVKRNVYLPDTISFPIAGKKSDREFQSRFDFMPLISSPGVAFIVVDEEPGASARAVFDSVLSGWPILLLTLLMALLSGMVMWALDTKYNPDEFPRSFFKGTGEGFWWAFVTMTTVGYGDRSPRGFLARIFAIIWVLVGLVITSIFTGVVTTSLTAITLSTDVKLYGTSIVAITNSTEYRLGLNKNARIQGVENFDTLIKELKERKYKGALIDTYVAGEFQELQHESLRINKIIDYDSHYGIVFGGQGPLANNVFKKCVEEYVLINKAQIFKQVEENTSPMKKPAESAAVEKSSGLFDSTSPLFKNAVYGTLGMLLLFTACGILWDYGYMRHWRKKTELEELELLGGPAYDMAMQNLRVMDSLMEEVQEFYDSWTARLDEMSARHDQEQKQLSRHQR